MLVAWLIFPLILLALCVGVGLLIDVLSGRRMPGALVPVAGFAGVVVVGSLTTLTSTTAPWTVPVLVVLGLVGAFLSWPWRFGRPDPLVAGVAVAVFLVYGAPIIASGEPTFAGYIKLDDTATWLAITDRIMEHGRGLDGLEPSTYERTLEFNVGGGYPVGVFVPFGAAAAIVGSDLAWVFQPFESFLTAMLALALWVVIGGAIRDRRLLAPATFIASQPALLVGYAFWGGVKELAAAALVAFSAAVAPAALRFGAGWRDTFPLALSAASIVGVLSLGGLVWLGPMLLALFIWVIHDAGLRTAIWRSLGFLAPIALLVAPVLAIGLIPPTSSPLTEPDAQGNLRGPLNPFQAVGIWPTDDFRLSPEVPALTAVLVGLALLCAAVGAGFAYIRRNRALLFYATAITSAAAIVVIGSPWVGGKALATVSPVLLALAMVGGISILRLDRVTGIALILAVSGGVVWSNALAYTDPSLAPYDRFAELEQIGEEFAGEGPALMTEYNPYGVRHFLRELDPEGASELRHRPVNLREGGTPEKGEDVDVDRIELESVLPYRTIVIHQSPDQSRPPVPYELTGLGDHYEVWQRPVEQNMLVLSHMPVTGDGVAYGVPDCSQVRGLGLLPMIDGLDGARLVAASPDREAPLVELPLDRAAELCGQEWDWIATVLG